VHAFGNGLVGLLYLVWWLALRWDRHLGGKLLGPSGGTLAWATGYLAGHISLAPGAVVGERGLVGAAATGNEPSLVGGWIAVVPTVEVDQVPAGVGLGLVGSTDGRGPGASNQDGEEA